jgi:hypothetical protein
MVSQADFEELTLNSKSLVLVDEGPGNTVSLRR